MAVQLKTFFESGQKFITFGSWSQPLIHFNEVNFWEISPGETKRFFFSQTLRQKRKWNTMRQ